MSISINHDRVLEEKYHVCFQLDDYVDDHNHNCAVMCPSLLKMNANDDRHLHAGANHRKKHRDRDRDDDDDDDNDDDNNVN